MKDLYIASALSLFFAVILLMNWRFEGALEFLGLFGRPAASVLVLGSILVLHAKGLRLTSLVAAVLSVYLLKMVWTTWPRSDERRLHLEIGRDQARWDPVNSIDLQFANKTTVHDAPDMLVTPVPFPEMLVFPPSSDTLHEMCG
jgi:hypothetical protein